jgi:predicted nucleotidyltransferase
MSNNYGLDEKILSSLCNCFEQIELIEKVILYGSRAKGNYKRGSDIDITLFGKNLTLNNSVYPLMEIIEELLLPYSFDISIFSHIKDEKLIEHINRVGKMLYKKENK